MEEFIDKVGGQAWFYLFWCAEDGRLEKFIIKYGSQDLFYFVSSVTWMGLRFIGWVSQLAGWALIALGGFTLIREPLRGESPYQKCLVAFLGGVALIQAEDLLRTMGDWFTHDANAGQMGNLDDWFAFGEKDLPTITDRLKDIMFNLAAVGGYGFFAFGIWRTARVGHPNSKGQPIQITSAVAMVMGGLLLVYLPWLVDTVV